MSPRTGLPFIESAKRTLKKHRSSKNPIIRLALSMATTLWKIIKTPIRLCRDQEYRSIFFMQLLRSKKVHQTTSLTYMDRYPIIFSACRDHLAGKEGLKILSYGCSTGEEVLTLRQYFPHATIIGADINKRSLETCRKLPVDENVAFIYSTPHELQRHGPFDAIFCMAVLQRTPHTVASSGVTSLKKIYPFEKFERQIIELDEFVRPGGLLVVHFTQYSLLDTSVAPKYEVVGDYNQDDYNAPIFDRNSERILHPAPQPSIFAKKHR